MVAVHPTCDRATRQRTARWQHLPSPAGRGIEDEGTSHDAVVLRDRDTSGGENGGVLEERLYYCQNWRHDVVAVVSDVGEMIEWITYSPYGVPFGMPAGDTDSDGDWDVTDANTIRTSLSYDVREDANLDGTVDSSDITHANSITGGYQTLGRTVLSSTAIENILGYAGYVHDPALAGTKWHVRHRVLEGELGRWLQRDLLEYLDGPSLYQYAKNAPMELIDPSGRISIIAGCALGAGITGGMQLIRCGVGKIIYGPQRNCLKETVCSAISGCVAGGLIATNPGLLAGCAVGLISGIVNTICNVAWDCIDNIIHGRPLGACIDICQLVGIIADMAAGCVAGAIGKADELAAGLIGLLLGNGAEYCLGGHFPASPRRWCA